MKKKNENEILDALQEFTKDLEEGKPLTDKYRVTKIEKVNKFEAVRTTKGPKKKKWR